MKNFHRVLVVLLVLISLSIIIDKQIEKLHPDYHADFYKHVGFHVTNKDKPNEYITYDGTAFWTGCIKDRAGNFLRMRRDGKVSADRKNCKSHETWEINFTKDNARNIKENRDDTWHRDRFNIYNPAHKRWLSCKENGKLVGIKTFANVAPSSNGWEEFRLIPKTVNNKKYYNIECVAPGGSDTTKILTTKKCVDTKKKKVVFTPWPILRTWTETTGCMHTSPNRYANNMWRHFSFENGTRDYKPVCQFKRERDGKERIKCNR